MPSADLPERPGVVARTLIILGMLACSSVAWAGHWQVGSEFGHPGEVVEVEVRFEGDGQTVVTSADMLLALASLSVPVDSGPIGVGTGEGSCWRLDGHTIRMILSSVDANSPLGTSTSVCRIPFDIAENARPFTHQVFIVSADCANAAGDPVPCSAAYGSITVHGVPGGFNVQPAVPRDGEMVQIEFYGSGCGGGGFDRIEDRTIHFRESISCSCFATAPGYRVRSVVGPLEYGSYRVVSSVWEEELDDPELCGPPTLLFQREWEFLVAIGPREIPTGGAITAVALLLGITLIGLLTISRR